MAHGDPKHPKKNPHPVQRYEVIATANAPGPWDSVHGYIGYEVSNPDCTPKDKFLGVHAMPPVVGTEIEMTRVGEKTWKGYFYRDAMQDEDYFGLGMCHWDVASVSANFTLDSLTFGSGDVFDVLLKNGSQTEYFKKSAFLARSFKHGGDGTTPNDPEVIQHPDAFFPITVAIKEVKP